MPSYTHIYIHTYIHTYIYIHYVFKLGDGKPVNICCGYCVSVSRQSQKVTNNKQ